MIAEVSEELAALPHRSCSSCSANETSVRYRYTVSVLQLDKYSNLKQMFSVVLFFSIRVFLRIILTDTHPVVIAVQK